MNATPSSVSLGPSSFAATWNPGNFIEFQGISVIFGFTSDVGPMLAPVTANGSLKGVLSDQTMGSAPSPAPEPRSVALLGIGVLLAAFFQRVRRRNADC
jgi:hypothetical protein